MLKLYRAREDGNGELGRLEDGVTARLARLMVLHDVADPEEATARFEVEAIGFIRADGVATIGLFLILWFLIGQIPGVLVLLEPRPDTMQGLVTVTFLVKIALALWLAGRTRDIATEVFAPQSAFATRRPRILACLEARKKKGSDDGAG